MVAIYRNHCIETTVYRKHEEPGAHKQRAEHALFMRSGLLVFSPPAASRARCSPRDPEGEIGSTSRGWKWVGLGVEMGGGQVVEMGRFRYM